MKINLAILITVTLLAISAAFAADDVEMMKQLTAPDWTVPEIALEMKRIPAGTFTMGSPENEMCRRADETQHNVTISKPFYMGIYEVTQRQFYKLMMPDYDFDSWKYKRGPIADGAAYCFRFPTEAGLIFNATATGGPQTDLNPMECVTWERAGAFCKQITELESKAGRLPEGYAYRLPTEAEWEYACRAGTQGPYNVESDYTILLGLRKFAWLAGAGSSMGTRSVGKDRTPNAWGLCDMHGNVYEWCLDWYGPYNATGSPQAGKEKVVRGGGFTGYTKDEELDKKVHPFMRSASRYSITPDLAYLNMVGFRMVLGPEITQQARNTILGGRASDVPRTETEQGKKSK